jgi:hypothetical protein
MVRPAGPLLLKNDFLKTGISKIVHESTLKYNTMLIRKSIFPTDCISVSCERTLLGGRGVWGATDSPHSRFNEYYRCAAAIA